MVPALPQGACCPLVAEPLYEHDRPIVRAAGWCAPNQQVHTMADQDTQTHEPRWPWKVGGPAGLCLGRQAVANLRAFHGKKALCLHLHQ